jgi:hypothetical protein
MSSARTLTGGFVIGSSWLPDEESRRTELGGRIRE